MASLPWDPDLPSLRMAQNFPFGSAPLLARAVLWADHVLPVCLVVFIAGWVEPSLVSWLGQWNPVWFHGWISGTQPGFRAGWVEPSLVLWLGQCLLQPWAQPCLLLFLTYLAWHTRPDLALPPLTEQLSEALMFPALPFVGALGLHHCQWGLPLPVLGSPLDPGWSSLMEQPNSCCSLPFSHFAWCQSSIPAHSACSSFALKEARLGWTLSWKSFWRMDFFKASARF